MTVDTRRVKGRRTVHYETFDDLLRDAETLAAGEVRSLGNWSLGQTLAHLGKAMSGSVDGEPFDVPWWVKLLGRLYLRRRLINGPFPAGFQLPRGVREKLVVDHISTEEGMAILREGIERLRSTDKRLPGHPVAGPMTTEDWDRLHLRHAEMHMSFLLPAETTAAKSS